MADAEKKGLTVKIDADLHAEVRQYLDAHEMTMAEFVTLALQDELHSKNNMKEGNTMEKTRKPDCPLIGQDGNIFNLTGIAARTLRRSGPSDRASEMTNRVYASGSYYEALNIIGEYVNITSVDEPNASEDFDDDELDIDCDKEDDEDEDEDYEPSLS